MKVFAYMSVAASLFVTACAGSGAGYQPIVDGNTSANYKTDLASCQSLAEERSYFNADTKNDAMIGAALGAVLGLLDEGDSGAAVGGAIAGGLAGAGSSAYKARDERRLIVIDCMKGRGHAVVG